LNELSQRDWQKRSKAINLKNKAFIDGKWVDAASGKTFDVVNPATNQLITQVAECGEEDVNRAVKAARVAFNSGVWSCRTPQERKAVLLKMAELVRAHRDELAVIDTSTWANRSD
jgi:gamma-glutamyl-gamma-aminobutyraldehyde dehydrogenase